MNILIVSYEAWRETNNGGNVLSNIFSAFQDANIAQIYCTGEYPNNSVCQKYFQISDLMLLSEQKGHALIEKDYYLECTEQEKVVENRIKDKLPNVLKEFTLLAREILWSIAGWRTRELNEFVENFKPDVIFAPCYSYFHISKVALYVKSVCNCPMISYISDDNYSIKQFRFSPSFWINRIITRRWIRRHFAESSLVYTMTEMQKEEYENIFSVPMKVLCKSATFSEPNKSIQAPLKLIYGGGLYLNRWKVLCKLASILNLINQSEVKAELHIYSGTKLKKKQIKKLNDGRSSFLHDAVSFSKLQEKYFESDVAIHVESFDLRNRLITRLSFSTKIIDCMNSGSAILAIGPSSQAGIAYLKENDAAICVEKLRYLNDVIEKIVDNPSFIKTYSEKAKSLGLKNHAKWKIDNQVRQDFKDVISGNI